MEVERRRVESVTVLEVNGDVDLSTSTRLREPLLGALETDQPKVVIDLSEVTYMDSSGLATLVEGYQRARDRGGNLALCGLSERLHNIFELAHLHQVFTIHDDEAAALASFGEGPG